MRFALARFSRAGPPPSDLQNLVEVLRATGMRKPQGSATEFNRQLNHELALPPVSAELVAAAKTGGIGRCSRSSAARMAWPGTSELSDLFLAPESVDQIRAIAGPPIRQAATRSRGRCFRRPLKRTSPVVTAVEAQSKEAGKSPDQGSLFLKC
jgi:hypothetical protein